MKSKTLSSFWKYYEKLDEEIKKQARKAFKLWRENPFHPSLHFKCVNPEEQIWSLRITKGYRALCLYEKDLVVWFWIGNHDDHQRLIKK
jgi:mRNA-degrading endonuclease RelE of RelBE toxin-antitoxin system